MCILFLWHGEELENESGEKTQKRFGEREKRVRDGFDYLYKEINEIMCARGS